MQYQIEFRPKALGDLKRLSPDISKRIENKLELLCDNIAGDVKRLVDYTPGWRLRVGEWGILFEPRGATLVVHRVVHRSAAYE